MTIAPASTVTSSTQSVGCNPLARPPSPVQDVAMEHRLTRLEVTVQHIQEDLRDLRTDLREFKTEVRDFKTEVRDFKDEMRDFQKEVRSEFRDVRQQARTDFRLLFGAIISVAVGMAGLMAKGFHWL
jgi:peptidoglycan hydrolase CwlO-like protein